MVDRTYVCSIAGFDPSSGAGVGADLKTFEAHKVYGFAILTANTWQNDEKVERVRWFSTADILSQLDMLMPKFKIDFFKIGIIENMERLLQVTGYIKQMNPQATIIWDPVLRASSDFSFFQGTANWQRLRGKIDWVTPNLPEFLQLFGSDEAALAVSQECIVLKKGGHALVQQGRDLLFYQQQAHVLEPGITQKMMHPKHGSGCVLSAAICANLAKGAAPLKACQLSKQYIEKFLSSSNGLLGWHHH